MRRIVFALGCASCFAWVLFSAQPTAAQTDAAASAQEFYFQARAQFDQLFAAGKLADAEKTGRYLTGLYRDYFSTSAVRAYETHVRHGTVLDALGRHEEAAQVFASAEQVLKAAQIGGRRLATLQLGLANAYRPLGRYADADASYRRSISNFRADSGSSQQELAAGYSALGTLQKFEGNLADAERNLRIAKKLWPPTQIVEVAKVEFALGGVFELQGQLPEAEQSYLAAMNLLATATGATAELKADVLASLAGAELAQARFGEARDHFQQASKLYEPIATHAARGKQFLVQALVVHVDLATNQLAAAQQRLTELKENAASPTADLVGKFIFYQCQADLYQRQGRLPEAQRAASEGLALAEKSSVDSYSLSLYLLRAQIERKLGERDSALADFRRGLELAEKLRSSGADNEVTRALLFHSQGSSAFEQMLDYLAESKNPDDFVEALRTAERARARSLLDKLSYRGVDLLERAPAEVKGPLRAREVSARTRLKTAENELNAVPASDVSRASQLRNEIVSANQALNALEAEVNAVKQKYGGPLYSSAQNLDLDSQNGESVRSWLSRRKGLLLEYFVAKNACYLFVVDPRSTDDSVTQPLVKMIKLQVAPRNAAILGISAGPLTEQSLQDAIWTSLPNLNRSAQAVKAKPASKIEVRNQPLFLSDAPERRQRALACSAALWQTLVPVKVRDVVFDPKIEHLFVVPDGVLNRVPFEVLAVDPLEPLSYVLDVAPPITYGPSTVVLTRLIASAEEAPAWTTSGLQPVLTLGDPAYQNHDPNSVFAAYRGETLGRLPFSEVECKAVAQAFAAANIPVGMLSQGLATEAIFAANAPGRRLLHVACHGLTDPKQTGKCGLALTPGPAAAGASDDGLLSLEELNQLDLRQCDLAILSACQTNVGAQFPPGEGPWALARGFLGAGARRIVATQWLAEDETSAELIGDFCRGVARAQRSGGPVDYARLLRDSKRRIRNSDQWSDSFFWGEFVLIGAN